MTVGIYVTDVLTSFYRILEITYRNTCKINAFFFHPVTALGNIFGIIYQQERNMLTVNDVLI
jgi:hypothetical protein